MCSSSNHYSDVILPHSFIIDPSTVCNILIPEFLHLFIASLRSQYGQIPFDEFLPSTISSIYFIEIIVIIHHHSFASKRIISSRESINICFYMRSLMLIEYCTYQKSNNGSHKEQNHYLSREYHISSHQYYVLLHSVVLIYFIPHLIIHSFISLSVHTLLSNHINNNIPSLNDSFYTLSFVVHYVIYTL